MKSTVSQFATAPTSELPSRRTFKVLVVEDEHIYCQAIERILVREGFQVQTAFSGKDGITKGLKFRPDILVTDLGLGDEMDGLCVTETLFSADPQLLTILISGRPLREVLGKVEGRGISLFKALSKPFPLKELLEIVRAAGSQRV